MASHELGGLLRDDDQGFWYVVCSCSWESRSHRQRRFSMGEFADHIAEMTGTEVTR